MECKRCVAFYNAWNVYFTWYLRNITAFFGKYLCHTCHIFCVKFFWNSFTGYFLSIFKIIFNLLPLNTFIPWMIFLLFRFDIKTKVNWSHTSQSVMWCVWHHLNGQVCTFHDGCMQGIDQQIFNRKSISHKITHSQSWAVQAKLTGEKLKGWSNSREKTNSRLQSKFHNTSSNFITS